MLKIKTMARSEYRAKKMEKINRFFQDETTPEAFAKDMRRFLYESMKLALTPPEYRYIPDPKWVNNGINTLNMFCEILHPVLDEEDEDDLKINDYINI